ncbi:hypothetical protein Trihar35433_1208 [Trichoderma harzianum]|nr:hypothetical protein Trihar35433_1208 [Trichoderma harzianum]
MVTFALPGEYDGADVANGTPKSRPPLPFAKRTYVATPYANKRLSTSAASSRKLLITRDETMNQDPVSSSRNNLFRATAVESPPSSTTFSPTNLPQSTMKKVFAPGVTPMSNRVYRENTARATPRGLAANSSDKELFNMRISSPPPELTGEVLANKVPKDWNSKGSIYADQFLAHLCPPNLDDEQRRQFFCILDLRRLKYAANEIFTKKSWKLNIMNFAKEFEKSRSIILLRYGLYEFQSVKPSKEVLKRWRREHGLPDPVEEADEEAAEALDGTPSKPATAKKRKADDNLSKETVDATENVASAVKRRATVRDEEDEPTAATPAPMKNKRKATITEESPAKLQKTPSSSAKSLFEKIANKPAASPVPVKAAEKNAANGRLSRSVFTSLKPPANGVSNGNIFGYLSDASSAKNSGIEADAESESESDNDEEVEESQEAGQSDEPSGASDASPQVGSNLFNTKPSTAFGTGVSSAAGTRESTPGRSLFERITKGQDGQPVRADENAEEVIPKAPASSLNQTWNPTSTPLKFAPAAAPSTSQNGSLFGKPTSAPAGSIFAPKSTAPSNIFGVQSSKANTPVSETDVTGGESDKENDSQPTKKLFSEPKVAALPSTTAPSLFSFKPAAAEPPKVSEPAKPAATTTSLFGAIGSSDATSKLFGDVKTSIPSAPTSALFAPKKESEKPKGSGLFGTSDANATPLTGASAALFGIKPAETPAPAAAPAPATSLFGTVSSAPPATTAPAMSSNLFGTAAPASTSTNLFGSANSSFTSEPEQSTPAPTTTNLFGAASSAPTTSLFGASSSVPSKKDPSPSATTQPASAPLFSFGTSAGPKPTETSQAAAKSLFGAPKSPPAASSSLFAGSPMKQDAASPAKKQFGLGTDTSAPPPVFSFGSTGASSGSSNLFGNPAPSAPTPAPLFGATPSSAQLGSGDSNGGSFNFNFGSGAAAPASTGGFNNPFSGNTGGAPAPASAPAPVFSFGSSAQPGGGSGSSGGSGMFQFGNGTGSQPSQASTPLFGGASATTPSVPSFTATGPSSQPSTSMFSFGASSQPSSGFNLAPPAGGSSTTGTNSPFNLGGGSSLATTPAGGTPEPSAQLKTNTSAAENNDEEGEKHEQISLTEGVEKDEEVLHEVRAKVLKFVPAGEASESEEKKSKSPWATKGVGSLRLLKHKETNNVRLLLRAEPRGNVAMNRSVLPDLSYKADEKYVKMTTSNDTGDGLETWMIQVKTKDMAKALAESLETHKALNKK